MHGASSGLGLISLDLAGLCVNVQHLCMHVRGGPALVSSENGSWAGPTTRVGGSRGGHSPSGVVACRGRDLRMQRTHTELAEKGPSRPRIDEPTPENHVSHTFQTRARVLVSC